MAESEAQTLANKLAALDEETAINVVTAVLVSRPELAPPIVNFAVPDLTYPPSKSLVERRAKGTIKAYSPEKGFGYIDCPELKEVFGNDVFLHNRQNVLDLAPGTEVTFAVALGKDSKPQAFDLLDGNGAKPAIPKAGPTVTLTPGPGVAALGGIPGLSGLTMPAIGGLDAGALPVSAEDAAALGLPPPMGALPSNGPVPGMKRPFAMGPGAPPPPAPGGPPGVPSAPPGLPPGMPQDLGFGTKNGFGFVSSGGGYS